MKINLTTSNASGGNILYNAKAQAYLHITEQNLPKNSSNNHVSLHSPKNPSYLHYVPRTDPEISRNLLYEDIETRQVRIDMRERARGSDRAYRASLI